MPATGFVDRQQGKLVVGMNLYSVQPGIIAHAGGGQPNAVPLTAQNCFIATVVTAADSVRLPPARAGMEITVINQSATLTGPSAWGNGSDSINGVAGPTSIAIAPSTTMIFYCAIDGAWWTK